MKVKSLIEILQYIAKENPDADVELSLAIGEYAICFHHPRGSEWVPGRDSPEDKDANK